MFSDAWDNGLTVNNVVVDIPVNPKSALRGKITRPCFARHCVVHRRRSDFAG